MQKKKQYQLNKKRALITEQNVSNKKMKQNEAKQKREKRIDEYIDLGRFFELATSDKIYVNILNLHEIENDFLLEY